MRALIAQGSDIRLDSNRAAPKPAAGEAVVRLTRAMISRGDLTLAQSMPQFKGVLGRHFVGVAESVSGAATGNLTGKRVVGSCIEVCGKCDMCQGGLSAHCRQRSILGLITRDGCLAERFVIPAKNLVAVPDSVDDDHAVFANLLASAMQAAQQLTIVGKPYITVLGDGPLGLLMVQVMSKLNASVRLIGRHAAKLEMCEKWGVKHRHVDDVGRRADQDVVVDCTGTSAGFSLALQLVRPRGKVLLKSVLPADTGGKNHQEDLARIVHNEIELIGSHFGPIGDALAMITRREVDVVSLISRRMSLSDGPSLFKLASIPGSIAVLVEP